MSVILWMMLATGVMKPETVWWTRYPGPEPDGYPVPKIPKVRALSVGDGSIFPSVDLQYVVNVI